jgi:hypothetical protein
MGPDSRGQEWCLQHLGAFTVFGPQHLVDGMCCLVAGFGQHPNRFIIHAVLRHCDARQRPHWQASRRLNDHVV